MINTTKIVIEINALVYNHAYKELEYLHYTSLKKARYGKYISNILIP